MFLLLQFTGKSQRFIRRSNLTRLSFFIILTLSENNYKVWKRKEKKFTFLNNRGRTNFHISLKFQHFSSELVLNRKIVYVLKFWYHNYFNVTQFCSTVSLVFKIFLNSKQFESNLLKRVNVNDFREFI